MSKRDLRRYASKMTKNGRSPVNAGDLAALGTKIIIFFIVLSCQSILVKIGPRTIFVLSKSFLGPFLSRQIWPPE